MGKTADLSTSLRFGRDDKGEGRYGPWLRSGDGKPQISPLRCASVEMTKGRVVMVRGGGLVMGKTADLSTSLRFGRDDKRKGRYGPWLRSGDGQNRRSLHFAALRSR